MNSSSTGTVRDGATPLVEARGLIKDYGRTQAVRDVSFTVYRGEVVGFLGPNGAGKSTTMKMLTGYLRPTAGKALVAGIDVAEDPIAAQRVLGYLPESAPMYLDMMVIDFLHFIADLRGVTSDVKRGRIRAACERCGLMDVLGKDIGQLSKGYRQRVGLAQALLHDPDLLILDEPTSGLDPNQIVEIRALIKDLGRDKTVILSTHILPEVQATCDRIIIINDGQVVADDTPDALTGEGAGAMIRVVLRIEGFVDPAIVRQVLSGLPGVLRVDIQSAGGATVNQELILAVRASKNADPREAIFGAAVANHWVLLELHRDRVSLEDTFQRLTQREGDRHAA